MTCTDVTDPVWWICVMNYPLLFMTETGVTGPVMTDFCDMFTVWQIFNDPSDHCNYTQWLPPSMVIPDCKYLTISVSDRKSTWQNWNTSCLSIFQYSMLSTWQAQQDGKLNVSNRTSPVRLMTTSLWSRYCCRHWVIWHNKIISFNAIEIIWGFKNIWT